KEWRRRWGVSRTDPGHPAVSLDQLPEALARQGPPARGQEELRRPLPIEPGTDLGEIAVQPLPGRPAERDEPLPPALSRHAQHAVGQVDGIAGQADELGDAQAAGIGELEHGPVANAQGPGVWGGQERLDLL